MFKMGRRTFAPVNARFAHTFAKEFDPKDYSDTIKNNKVAIFSVTYCPHCARSKSLVKDAYVVEVNTLKNEEDVRKFLNETTGQRTFPKNFINGEFIGGNSDLEKLMASGKFK